MQENNVQKIKCRCCGQSFRVDAFCPYCGFQVIVVLGDHDSQVEAFAKKWREEHASQIVKCVGVVYNQPAKWNGEELVPGARDYMKLADISELTNEFLWKNETEFASFGRGEDASLRVYMEYLDGSKAESEVPIQLPPVRGVTWKAAARMAESGDGVEFAVGVPEKFTKTEKVKFCK